MIQRLKSRGFIIGFFFASLILSFLLYGNTLRGQFVFDDYAYVYIPTLIRPGNISTILLDTPSPNSVSQGVYRPLTQLTFGLNFWLFGKDPTSFHIVSILLNGIVVFLVYIFVLELFGDTRLAFITSVLFAVLPIHTEAVAYVKARDELLDSLFRLTGWILLLKATVKPNIRYVWILLASFSLGLAVLSKDFAYTAPFVGLVFYYLLRHPGALVFGKVGALLCLFPFMALLLRIAVLGGRTFGGDRNLFVINPLGYVDTLTRISTAGKIAFLYITKTFIPYGLSATYHFNHLTLVPHPLASWESIIGFMFLVLMIVLLIIPRTRRSPVGFGVLLFLGTYGVFSKFFFKWGDIFAERWMYLPSLGLLLPVAWGLVFLLRKRPHEFGAVLTILVLLMGTISISRNKVWLSQKRIGESMVATAPDSIVGRVQLAKVYLQEGNFLKAREHVAYGMNIYDQHPSLLELAAALYYQEGDYVKARQLIAQANKLTPDLTGAWLLEALILSREGRYEESSSLLKEKLGVDTSDSKAIFVRAYNRYKLGEIDRAFELMEGSGLSKEEILTEFKQFEENK